MKFYTLSGFNEDGLDNYEYQTLYFGDKYIGVAYKGVYMYHYSSIYGNGSHGVIHGAIEELKNCFVEYLCEKVGLLND